MTRSEYESLFLSEAQEILNSLNVTLVELEKEPDDSSLLHEVFRQSHTLKSLAQSMGYEEMGRLTHSMENALALLRSGRLKAEKDIVDLLFESLDAIRRLVDGVRNRTAKKVNVLRLVKRFEEIDIVVSGKKGKPLVERRSGVSDRRRRPVSASPGETLAVRIPLLQLDSLMGVIGELTLNKIRFVQIAQTIESYPLKEAVVQMSRLTAQLQDQMMQIRLLPLEYIFHTYQRMVRDMAAGQKKEVDLLIEGAQIGLDRSIQDEINQSMLHLLKNAVIHGIEEPEERKKLKKPRRGKIKLIARREKGFVVITFSDDGRGMTVEEVKKTAVRSGIITREEAQTLSSKEAVMLITCPGFSRVDKVTEAAGRGVGLNAVRIKVESLGGILEIDTRPNEGTTFQIKLPLTMSIIQAMLVEVADEVYGIPLSYIVEALWIIHREIKTMEHHEVITYRDKVLPLVRLREKLGFPRDHKQGDRTDKRIPVVVVETGAQRVGLIVEAFSGQQEVVIMPLRGIAKEVKYASGATILGTGKVALIVDVPAMV